MVCEHLSRFDCRHHMDEFFSSPNAPVGEFMRKVHADRGRELMFNPSKLTPRRHAAPLYTTRNLSVDIVLPWLRARVIKNEERCSRMANERRAVLPPAQRTHRTKPLARQTARSKSDRPVALHSARQPPKLPCPKQNPTSTVRPKERLPKFYLKPAAAYTQPALKPPNIRRLPTQTAIAAKPTSRIPYRYPQSCPHLLHEKSP